MKSIAAKRTDIAFFIKLYPLPMHKAAYEKAKAIYCERSMKMLEDAFEGKKIPPAKCQTDQIDKNIEFAKKVGISGTPYVIFSNGVRRSGAAAEDKFLAEIIKNSGQ